MDREIFIRYFEGSISHDEEKRLLAWIDESEENRRLFLQERQVWDMLLLNYPEDKQQENITDSPSRVRKLITGFAKIAAIFLVAILTSLYFLGKREEPPQAWNTIEVPVGQRTQLTLADGTKVWLNAKTRFSFPDKFSKDIRLVKLDGEAVFDVVHNDNAPFVVNTNKFNVRVLGTEFNVYAYSKSGSFETTLLRGKVVIESIEAGQKSVELKPWQMAHFKGDLGEMEIRQVDIQQSIYWREGIYSFENESLGSIFQRLERYYGVEFNVENKKILNDRFTGKFRYRDPIEVILEVVKKSSRFRYSKLNDKITIY